MDYNLDENQCDDKEIDQEPTVRGCIENYINTELGCNIPWSIHKDSRKQDCVTHNQFQRYQSLAKKFTSMNSREMGQKTGCIRRCKRMTYKLSETSPVGSKTSYAREVVKLSFVISSGNSRRERHIYLK